MRTQITRTFFAMFLLALMACVTSTQAQIVFGGGGGGGGSVSTGGGGGYGELKVGDPAPGLDILTWYPEGETKIEQGTVYVIDFFSPTNLKCLRSIPSLALLQQLNRHRGLRVISISKDPDEYIQAFRQANLEFDLHTLAVDNKETTTKAWQHAANAKAIPTSFVVDRTGRIVHIGDPLHPRFTEIVMLTIYDRYDPKLYAEASVFVEGAEKAAKIRNYREAARLYDMAIQREPRVLAPIAVQKLELILTQENEYEKGYAVAREMLKEYENDPFILANVAEMIATHPMIENRDFELATAMAQLAVEKTRREDPEYLSTLATVYAARGNYVEAFRLESDAFRLAVPLQKPIYKQRAEELKVAIEGGAKPELISRRDRAEQLQANPISSGQ